MGLQTHFRRDLILFYVFDMTPFSYSLFLHRPIASFALTSLILAFISLWIHKRAWLFGSFLGIAFILAFMGKLISLTAFFPLILLAGAHVILNMQIGKWSRLIIVVLAMALSFGLLLHLWPGFHNWLMLKDVKISPHAYPYTLYLNFDKPFIGFFVLSFTLPLLENHFQVRVIALKTLIVTCLGIMVMLLLSLELHVIQYDIKCPSIAPVWLVSHLFLTVIPEEAFFRGFIQRELTQAFHHRFARVFSVMITSLIFTAMHLLSVQSIPYLLLVFIASLIYGSIYQVTQSIESSIFCHYLLNVVHFFFFTYPIFHPSS